MNTANTIAISAMRIPKADDLQPYLYLLDYLSIEKRKRIMQINKVEDAIRSLFADVLLRTMICRYGQLGNSDLIFEHNAYGKPFLAAHNTIEFNMSHSGDWVVAALHHSPIGVDIEKIREIKYRDVSERFFSSMECNDLLNEPEEQQLHYFYDLWTLKESYIKNVGQGLSLPLSSFTLSKKDGYYDVTTPKQTGEQFQFQQYTIDDHYKFSVCIQDRNRTFPAAPILAHYESIIDEFLTYC